MLLAEDDYPLHQTVLPLAHVMDGHPNAYDRFWFNGYDEEFYFAFALGLYPNRGSSTPPSRSSKGTDSSRSSRVTRSMVVPRPSDRYASRSSNRCA